MFHPQYNAPLVFFCVNFFLNGTFILKKISIEFIILSPRIIFFTSSPHIFAIIKPPLFHRVSKVKLNALRSTYRIQCPLLI